MKNKITDNQQRASFFIGASRMLSSLLEENPLDDTTATVFIDWCYSVCPVLIYREVAVAVLTSFQTRALEDMSTPSFDGVFKTSRELPSCEFASSLYSFICCK